MYFMGNAKYPNKFHTKEKYISSLIGKYSLQYQSLDLSIEQWELPITKAVNCVAQTINLFDNYQWALKAIGLVVWNGIRLSEQFHSTTKPTEEIYYLAIGDEAKLKNLLKEEFPESQKEQYLEFVSRMAKDVVIAICLETLKSIPEAEKIKYQSKFAAQGKACSYIAEEFYITEESKKEQSCSPRDLDEDERKQPSVKPKKRKVSFLWKL